MAASFGLIMVGALAGGVLYGKKPGVAAVGLAVAAYFALWAFLHKRARAGIGLFMIFLAAAAVVLFRPSSFYDAVYRVDGRVSGLTQSLTGRGDAMANTGTVSRRNNYRTGRVRMELTVSDVPAEPLYLRGFSGGEYVGDRWRRAGAQALFDEVAQTLYWEEWRETIGGTYYNMYFALNQAAAGEEAPGAGKLHIRHVSGDYTDIYMPYFGRCEWVWRDRRDLGEEGYEIDYYERKDLGTLWNGQQADLWTAERWYRSLHEAYREAARTAYTRVPEELLPRLTELAEENPRENLDEITTFIINTLQSRASYSLTPGWAPINEDIVEYFLFENGQGYCQHFASAATLLYRLYGIPARYACGYVVQPSDFTLQEGVWRVDVTDEFAHAWTEIFLEDYGWMPVEVTPAADGRIYVSYPGLDSAALNGLAIDYRQGEEEWPGNFYEDTYKESDRRAEEGYSVYLDFEKYREIYLVVGSCLFCLLFLTPVFLDYRRLRYRHKLNGADCGKVYGAMMDMLHYAGYFLDAEGWEKDFPVIAAAEFQQVGEEELRRQQNIVKQALYGAVSPEPEEEQFVRWVYFRMAEAVSRRIKGYRGLLFRYWKKYG